MECINSYVDMTHMCIWLYCFRVCFISGVYMVGVEASCEGGQGLEGAVAP